jgi:choline transport protein
MKQMDASYDPNMMDDARLEAALGHKQELKRHFDLFSLVSLGIVIAK